MRLNAQVQFLPLNFTLQFEEPITSDVPPLFIVRSLLGSNLHDICCIAHRNSCQQCEHNSTCIYAQVFDTIVEKDNEVVRGRERAPHPFTISVEDWRKPVHDSLTFTIVLLGKAIEYASYIAGAFQRGQDRGFGKHRIPYSITSVVSAGNSLLSSQENFSFQQSIRDWKPSNSWEDQQYTGRVLIKLKSPLRFKERGTYTDTFTPSSLLSCFQRRMETLCLLYGLVQERENIKPVFEIVAQDTVWKDYPHYSARQRTSMYLGGVMGDLELVGEFSAYELDLFSFCELFQAGKNTSFGFGKLSVWRQFQQRGGFEW